MDTKWTKEKVIIEEIDRTIPEKKKPNKENEVDKMNKKLKELNERKKNFSKQPLLENIYEIPDDNKNYYDYDTEDDEELDKVVEGFTLKEFNSFFNDMFGGIFEEDFVDVEYYEGLESLGLLTKDGKKRAERIKKKYIDIKHPDGSRSCPSKVSFVKGELVQKIRDPAKKAWNVKEVNGDKVKIERTEKGKKYKQTVNEKHLERYNPLDFFGLFNYIKYIPKLTFAAILTIKYICKKIIVVFCDMVSQFDAGEDDKRFVIAQFFTIVNFFIVIYITYNLFYLWFYRGEDGKYIKHHNWSETILKDKRKPILDETSAKINGFMNFIFEYILFPMTVIDRFFMGRDGFVKLPMPFSFFGFLPVTLPTFIRFLSKFFGLKNIDNVKWFLVFFLVYYNVDSLSEMLDAYAKGEDYLGLVLMLLFIGISLKSFSANLSPWEFQVV